ncbi:MAG: hypothetical protein KJ638_05170 [Chloroflexi bacterium]|nr:hypothetical protein [Chloroflexota bacterium]
MKNRKKLNTIVFLLVLASTLLVAAAPGPQQSALAATTLARLTIENNTNDYVTLQLSGPASYYLYVKPGETRIYTLQRGEYSNKFYSCGVFINTSLDMTKHQKIVVPACGTHATTNPTGVIDAGKVLRLVKVTLKNATDHNIVIVLNGPSEYAFFLYDQEERSYTIPKGDYSYIIYGCGYIREGTLFARALKYKELTCPAQ